MATRVGECVVDLERGTVHRAGALVSLRPKVFDLLAHGIRNPGRLLSKDELLAVLWPDTIVSEDSLTQCVRGLRKAIGDERQDLIRTVARRGYLFQLPEPTSAPTSSAEPMVAVLPFRAAPDATDHAVPLDGAVEEITNALACFRTVAVLARHSAFALARPDTGAFQDQVARFGIDYLVDGTVSGEADGLRVTVALSEAASGRRVWTHAFPLAAEAVLTLPAAIARQVITALAATIESAAMRRAANAPATRSVAAYGHLLRGMSLLRGYGPGVNAQARDHFVESIRLDPESGLAHAYLALARTIIGGYGAAPADVLRDARDTALEAVARAPDEARCHRILGLILLYCRDFDAAERHYARALDINPYDADTLMQMGHLLAMRGKPQAGLALADRAVALNPLHPAWYHFDRAEILFSGGQYADAAAALSCLPRKTALHMARLAAACALAGDLEQAHRHAQEGRRLEPGLTIARILPDVASEQADSRDRLRWGLHLAGWPDA